MNAYNVYPSNYLKAEDIPAAMTVTIDRVTMETMHDKSGQEIEKPVIIFGGLTKGLVCNKTNWKKLIELFGGETDTWRGHQVTVATVRVKIFNEVVDSIQLEAPKAAAPVRKLSEADIRAQMAIADDEPAVPEPETIDPQY